MTLGWILAVSFAGGTLSAALAAFALYLRASWIPMLVSFADRPLSTKGTGFSSLRII